MAPRRPPPAERELAERYGCSLITVRRALADLARERPPGADARPRHVRHSARRSTSTSTARCRSPRRSSAWATTRRRASSRRATVRRASRRRGGARTSRHRLARSFYLERLRIADGEPLLLEQVLLPEERFPGPARRRPRGRLAVRAARRALRHPGRPRPRVARADRPPAARGPAARRRRPHRPALLHRGPRLRPVGAAGRVRALVRPGRPDALLRRAGRRPLQPAIRRTSMRGAVARRDRRRARRRTPRAPPTVGGPRLARRSTCERLEPSPPSPCWRWSPARAAAVRRPPRRRPSGAAAPSAAACEAPARPTAPRPRPHADRDRRVDARARPDEIRWYCCLGGGDAPEQMTVEDKVVADFNASHPNIHADLRGRRLRQAPTAARDRDRSPATAPTSSARSASAAPTPSTASGWTSRR